MFFSIVSIGTHTTIPRQFKFLVKCLITSFHLIPILDLAIQPKTLARINLDLLASSYIFSLTLAFGTAPTTHLLPVTVVTQGK